MEQIKNRACIFGCFFAAILLVYSLFLRQTYNMDMVASYGKDLSYVFGISMSEFDPVGAIKNSVAMGRYLWIIQYVITFALHHFGIGQVSCQFVIQLIAFFFLACGATVLLIVFDGICGVKTQLLFGCILLSVASPAFAEIMNYTCFEYCIAFFLCTLAVKAFTEEHFIISIVFLVTAFGFYQSYYADFLIYGLTYILIREIKGENRICKRFFIEMVKLVSVDFAAALFAVVFSSLLCRILGVTSLRSLSFGGLSILYARLVHIIPRYGLSILTAGGVLPMGMLLAIIAVLSIVIVASLCRNNKVSAAVLYLIYLVIAGFAPMAVHFFEETPYLPPRTLTSAYGAIGCILMVAFCFVSGDILKNVTMAAGCVYLIFMAIGVNAEISDISSANKIEVMNLKQIGLSIRKYESETGTKVIRASVYHFGDEGIRVFDEKNLEYYGPYLYTPHIITGYVWSDVASLNYFAELDLDRTDMEESEREQFFTDYDMDDLGVFDPYRQLHFVGDTMYWITY